MRAIQLKIYKVNLIPLLFIAPRGLVTILFFLGIPSTFKIDFVSNALIIQVIVLTALIMMLGLMFNKKDKVKKEKVSESALKIDINVPL